MRKLILTEAACLETKISVTPNPSMKKALVVIRTSSLLECIHNNHSNVDHRPCKKQHRRIQNVKSTDTTYPLFTLY
jgi:hypothetical protein